MITPDELMQVANVECKSGYLKWWKAQSMVQTLVSLKETNCVRTFMEMHRYIRSCLYMEGFSEKDIDTITKAVYDKYK